MRKFTSSVVVAVALAAFAAALFLPTESQAQQAPAKAPTKAATKAPVAAKAKNNYKAPRTKDGKPNLNGIWMSNGLANWDLEPHASGPSVEPKLGSIFAVPPSMGYVVGGKIPYKPEALAIKAKNFQNRAKEDPEAKCYMGGIPRANYMPYPFQIIQGAKDIMISYQYAGAVRTINMGKPIEAPANAWMGQNNGHWEGETLVVDVAALDPQSWLTRAGDPHSENLHVVERFTMQSPDMMMYEARLEDPDTYTEPWTIRIPLYRQTEDRLLEFKCVVYAEELLYGDLRKPPGAITPPPADNGKGKGKGAPKGKGKQ